MGRFQFPSCDAHFICGIKLQQKIPDIEVLQQRDIPQLRWCTHLVRMSDHRLPKQVFFDELCAGIQPRGRPLRRHKDCLKTNLRRCNVRTGSLSPRTAANGAMHCSSGIQNFEVNRIRTIYTVFRKKHPLTFSFISP